MSIVILVAADEHMPFVHEIIAGVVTAATQNDQSWIMATDLEITVTYRDSSHCVCTKVFIAAGGSCNHQECPMMIVKCESSDIGCDK